jgi:hypothetical protein
MSSLWVRVAYAAVLALIVAFTLGFGVNMVYSGPKAPDTPAFTFAQLQSAGNNQNDADRLTKAVDAFYQGAYDYRRAYPDYQRNIFVAFTALAVILAAVAIALPAIFNFLRLGLTVGALLLLAYAVFFVLGPRPNPAPPTTGSLYDLLAAGSPPGLDFAGRFLRFAISFIGLLVLLFVGLWRLTEWAPRKTIAAPAFAGVPPAFAPPASVSSAPVIEPMPQATAPLPETSPEQLTWKRPETE